MKEITPSLRKEALALYLNMYPCNVNRLFKQSDYDELLFEVKPTKKRFGTSPKEVIDNCKVLENGFSVVGIKPLDVLHDVLAFERIADRSNEAKNKDALYHMIDEQFDLNEQTKKMKSIGIHTLVNTLYHLINPKDFPQVREYFVSGDVKEYRKLQDSNDGEYLVLTYDEADRKVREYISETVWAFNPSFLKRHMPEGMTEEVLAIIQEKCEAANEPLKSMIADFDQFVDDAITADGRGHFMNTYDGEEGLVEMRGVQFYIYRTN